MPANYVFLGQVTVGGADVASISFANIPSTGYTDLVLKVSARSSATGASAIIGLKLTFNGSSSTFSRREVYQEGGAVGTETVSDNIIGIIPNATATGNVFGSAELYVPNYTSSNPKTFIFETTTENNALAQGMWLTHGLWNTTTAINSVGLLPNSGNFITGSTFTLYGVAKLNTTPVIAPKASGGSIVKNDGTYWYHAFLSSGTFTPSTTLSCDVLVIAGGGGALYGGGGAGGYRSTTSLSIATATTVTVGAGGTGAATNGSNSAFSTITSTGGGKGATSSGGSGPETGSAGGSGGGSYSGSGSRSGGAGNAGSYSPVEGYAGGASSGGRGSGGGGAGGVGGVSAGGVAGVGGIGSNAHSTWASATGTGVSGYYAGGGGGYDASGTYVAGGLGGGGNGQGISGGGLPYGNTPGVANTGGGAGTPGLAGGSGIVIIRYPIV